MITSSTGFHWTSIKITGCLMTSAETTKGQRTILNSFKNTLRRSSDKQKACSQKWQNWEKMKAFRNVCLCFINEVQRFRYTTQKNWSLISSQKKVMLFLVNSLYICIGTGFWGKFYIYTSKILFVSHKRASWPNHMTQFLSRSVVTHHTTHIAIYTWHDLDF